jgi:LAO/AO transport system kinase
LHYLRPITPGWKTEALTCSALTGAGIPEVWQMIQKFREETTKSGQFEARRRQQVSNWFDTLLTEAVLGKFFSDPGKKLLVDKIRQGVEQGELPVVMAVQSLIEHP